jgi:hypothetical protein
MGSLTTYLQREFARKCPPGWMCRPEVRLLSPDLEGFLGYSARVDVMLERELPAKRLWIEFEVSRADPVLNHAKFATAHLLQPQLPIDYFLAMVSPHVTRGRRNLACTTIALMRQIGMRAFQTVLLPGTDPVEVKRLNHLNQADLNQSMIPVEIEIERAITVTESLFSMSNIDVHFAGDLLIVFLNLRRWNADLVTPEGKQTWGRRTVTYFVYEAESGLFAPSKFCAYSPIAQPEATGSGSSSLGVMTVAGYSMLNDGTHALDGNAAVRHLESRLGMSIRDGANEPAILEQFGAWQEDHADSINVHPAGPHFLLPPPWFS